MGACINEVIDEKFSDSNLSIGLGSALCKLVVQQYIGGPGRLPATIRCRLMSVPHCLESLSKGNKVTAWLISCGMVASV